MSVLVSKTCCIPLFGSSFRCFCLHRPSMLLTFHTGVMLMGMIAPTLHTQSPNQLSRWSLGYKGYTLGIRVCTLNMTREYSLWGYSRHTVRKYMPRITLCTQVSLHQVHLKLPMRPPFRLSRAGSLMTDNSCTVTPLISYWMAIFVKCVFVYIIADRRCVHGRSKAGG